MHILMKLALTWTCPCRTPLGNQFGAFANKSAHELAATAIQGEQTAHKMLFSVHNYNLDMLLCFVCMPTAHLPSMHPCR